MVETLLCEEVQARPVPYSTVPPKLSSRPRDRVLGAHLPSAPLRLSAPLALPCEVQQVGPAEPEGLTGQRRLLCSASPAAVVATSRDALGPATVPGP